MRSLIWRYCRTCTSTRPRSHDKKDPPEKGGFFLLGIVMYQVIKFTESYHSNLLALSQGKVPRRKIGFAKTISVEQMRKEIDTGKAVLRDGVMFAEEFQVCKQLYNRVIYIYRESFVDASKVAESLNQIPRRSRRNPL